MAEFFASFTINFFAELGDKTQLAAALLASRFGFYPVALGILLAVLILQAVAVAFGSTSSYLFKNIRMVYLLASAVFLYFGISALKDKEDERAEEIVSKSGRSVVLTVFLAFLLMEFGDKTQIATVVKASTSKRLLMTYLGAVTGFYLSNLIGITAGKFLGEKIEERKLKMVSAAVFLGFGIYYLFKAAF